MLRDRGYWPPNVPLQKGLLLAEGLEGTGVFKMKPDLVPAGIDQFEDRLGWQGAAAEEDVRTRPCLVQHLQKDFKFAQISQRLDFREIDVGAEPAEDMP
jgi:hypothetical protein